MDPDQRLSAEQALAHPYLATYSDPDDEVCYQVQVYMCMWVCVDGRADILKKSPEF